MDPLIRAAQVPSVRRRLSELQAGARDTGSGRAGQRTDPAPVVESDRDALRREIEAQLRDQLAKEYEGFAAAERAEVHAEARAAGHALGLAEGRAEAAAQIAGHRDTLSKQTTSALDALETACKAALERIEAQVGEIAFAAVCRLLSRSALSRSFVLSLVHEICAGLPHETSATVRLHPRDIELLGELVSGQALRLRTLNLKVVPDETLELGGCSIEAASGEFEGGLESQLRRLHAVLTGPVPGTDE